MIENLTLNQALSIWSELEQAYHGTNGYGGNVAEIYAYRLQINNPSSQLILKDTDIGNKAKEEQAAMAAGNLYWLLDKFSKDRDCKITINGNRIKLLKIDGLYHRCHVTVEPK